jgi:hypothetical protein
MRTLETVAIVGFVLLVIILIVYGDRSVTSHWALWLGIALLVGVLIGVPAVLVTTVNRMGL